MERESTGTTPLATSKGRDHSMHEAPYKEDPASTRSVKKRRLLWCCGLCSVILVIVLIVLITLIFTIFKERKPTIHVDSLTLEGLTLDVNPATIFSGGVTVDLTLNALVSVKNPNYAAFSYRNTTALLSYHDSVIGESPVAAGKVKARSTTQFTSATTVHLSGALINQNLTNDLATGVLPLVTSVKIEGTAKVLGFIDLKNVKASALCDVSVFTGNLSQSFTCDYHVKL